MSNDLRFYEGVGVDRPVKDSAAWVQRLYAALKDQFPKTFVGQVEVNVFKGGISTINIKQTYKEGTE